MTFTLQATPRTQSADKLRAVGQIPAILYGGESAPASLALDYRLFDKLYQQAGNANLIDLMVAGQTPDKILIQAVQIDPVKGRIIHADFRRINMNQTIETTMHLNLVGESSAVKELGGTLVRGPGTLHIKCLPKDLVSHVDVDISSLKTFTMVIRIGDIQLPAGIKIMDNPQTLVAKVAAPLTEEQLKAMDEAPAKKMEDIEVEKKGKKEEEGEAGESEAEVKAAAGGEAKGEKSAKGGEDKKREKK